MEVGRLLWGQGWGVVCGGSDEFDVFVRGEWSVVGRGTCRRHRGRRGGSGSWKRNHLGKLDGIGQLVW